MSTRKIQLPPLTTRSHNIRFISCTKRPTTSPSVEPLRVKQERRRIICPQKELDEELEYFGNYMTRNVRQSEIREEAICVICTEAFKAKERVAFLECRHAFHPDCLTLWLDRKPTCPLCRHPV